MMWKRLDTKLWIFRNLPCGLGEVGRFEILQSCMWSLGLFLVLLLRLLTPRNNILWITGFGVHDSEMMLSHIVDLKLCDPEEHL